MKSTTRRSQVALIILFLLGTTMVAAQKDPIKFGKIDENDLKMTLYPLDSSAHAVILCDFGTSNFQYDVNGDKGWQVLFKRVVRIKVLDKEGVSAGDFKLKLYHSGTVNREILDDIDGTTFNLENGKVEKSRLENKNIMREDEDKNHIAVKFAMPNVRAGSVMDLSYTIKSDFIFNLMSWNFQTNYPVKWSEYIINVPEYFSYTHGMLGYNSLNVNETTTQRGSITFSSTSHDIGEHGVYNGTKFEKSVVDYNIERKRMVMENVPAFKEEAYLTTGDNYRSIYTSELAFSKSSNNAFKEYTTTWEKINKLLMESDEFGSVMKRAGYMDDEIALALKNTSTEKDKMLAIYKLVNSKMRWNGSNSIFSEDVKKAWKENNGNSADINLMLIAALRKAGLNITPIVLSTRSNGMINPSHPSVTDLNYVVGQVKIGDKEYLLDATEPLAPAGLLPVRCLNNKGRSVNEINPGWVDLSPGLGDKLTANYTLTLNPDGSLTGTSSNLREAYNALTFRKAVANSSSLEAYYKDEEKSMEGLEFTSKNIPTLDSIYKPLKEILSFKVDNYCEMSNDRLFISPFLFEKTSENPFKLKERLYPVEFPYPVNENLMFTWNLPAGYVVEQLPKPATITIADGGARFTYSATQNGNAVVIASNIQINKTLFLKDNYKQIKDFFNQIIAKQGEQFMLKKG